MNTVIIAHRGASALAKKENTIEAFKHAIELKADYVEFDIRRTKDNVLIAFHDDSINGRLISELTYKEISEEAAMADYTIPFLEDILKLCAGKIKLDIELKEAGYEKDVILLVKKYFPCHDFLMKSFIDQAVLNIKTYDPSIIAGLLLGRKNADVKRRINEYFPLRRLKRCKADFVSPNQALATRGFIKRMHIHRKKVYVWTVNDSVSIGKFLHKNVDGIITDRPDAGLHIRKGFQS